MEPKTPTSYVLQSLLKGCHPASNKHFGSFHHGFSTQEASGNTTFRPLSVSEGPLLKAAGESSTRPSTQDPFAAWDEGLGFPPGGEIEEGLMEPDFDIDDFFGI